MKRMELAKAREKKMRENVLRTIQRDYRNMSVDDFEDCIYVAIMDYFCHYNTNSLLQRKVLMLEKLVSKLQENYNRTFKQFCKAKYLIKRMVEIRRENAEKCICKDKLPFKLVKSVAVQVQTARCRGGDLCPGSSGVGLDPNFKTGSQSSSKSSSPRKPLENSQLSTSGSDNMVNSPITYKGTQATPSSNLTAVQAAGICPVSVSVPPAPSSNRNALVRQKSASKLPNGKSPIVVQAPVQRTVGRVLEPTAYTKSNSSVVIDLTNKDQGMAGTSLENEKETPARKETSSPAKNAAVQLQQPVQTRVVKTSVLSPMPQLPPLPPSPAYKSIVRRPPEPVLKVCKADQSMAGTSLENEKETSARKETSPPAKNAAVQLQQPVQTRVVKTSVLSPMPQLPPLPPSPAYKSIVRRPPQPVLKVCKADQSGIVLSWTFRANVPLANDILLYQVYACQENAGVTRDWSSVGDVKALPLPMACTLSQFREGYCYHLVVRAVDTLQILGEFSHPASILLVSKNGGTPSPNPQSPATKRTRR